MGWWRKSKATACKYDTTVISIFAHANLVNSSSWQALAVLAPSEGGIFFTKLSGPITQLGIAPETVLKKILKKILKGKKRHFLKCLLQLQINIMQSVVCTFILQLGVWSTAPGAVRVQLHPTACPHAHSHNAHLPCHYCFLKYNPVCMTWRKEF